VALTWVATPGATSYTVSRGLKASGPVTILGTATSPAYTDAAVTNGTTYYYLVSARNASSSSANSDVVSATPARRTQQPRRRSRQQSNQPHVDRKYGRHLLRHFPRAGDRRPLYVGWDRAVESVQ
jgi:hypothetical protein